MKKLDNKAFMNLVPAVLAIVIVFCLLFIGVFINGTIHEELEDSFGTQPSGSSATRAMASMNNTSKNWDSSIAIIQVVIIITILAMAIGAIFLFTKYR